GVIIDEIKLSDMLGVPVVKATARSGKGINALLEKIHLVVTGALRPVPSSFVMELPPYRKPQLFKTVMLSLKEKVLSVLMRAVTAAAPAGLLIWALANIKPGGVSLLSLASNLLDPVGRAMGLDGVILLAFLLGFPANEIVIPVMLMAYLSGTGIEDYSSLSSLSAVLTVNGWSTLTALCFCIFSLFHFPCATSLITVYKETKSVKWTLLSFFCPLVTGTALCLALNLIFG
nr:hypothetical protein [Eubacterium sp.]